METTKVAQAPSLIISKRAAIYCRVSSHGQKDNGSLEDQESHCRKWCKEKGHSIQNTYLEIYSGEDIDRPQLEMLREDIRNGLIDVVVADKVDRFSRADPAITAYVMVEAEQYRGSAKPKKYRTLLPTSRLPRLWILWSKHGSACPQNMQR